MTLGISDTCIVYVKTYMVNVVIGKIINTAIPGSDDSPVRVTKGLVQSSLVQQVFKTPDLKNISHIVESFYYLEADPTIGSCPLLFLTQSFNSRIMKTLIELTGLSKV